VIVDAVGVCENDKTDSRPLEKKKTVPFDTLVMNVAKGKRDPATLSSLAGRLARLDRQIDERDQGEIQKASGGLSLRDMTNKLLDAIDPDKQIERAKGIFKTADPSEDQIKKAAKQLVDEACKPFDDAKLRNLVIEVKRKNDQIIDGISKDKVTFSGFDDNAKEHAQAIVKRFHEFIEKNKDEILALQIFYNKPYGQRHLTFTQVKELSESIQKPPYRLTPELLWRAYEHLDRSRVAGAGPQKLLTNIISLVRFALGEVKKLEPFSETVNERFQRWMESQRHVGRIFSNQQVDWLVMIKDHIVSSLRFEVDDFEYQPFNTKGGPVKAVELFGSELTEILDELNEALAA
jgi:type I restriction enzyme R subunit